MSYRTVPMAPIAPTAATARYVEREYGERYRIGYAGFTTLAGRGVYVYQVLASDGSRFLVASDAYENVTTLADVNATFERETAELLDVEIS